MPLLPPQDTPPTHRVSSDSFRQRISADVPAISQPAGPESAVPESAVPESAVHRIDSYREMALRYTAAWCSQDAASVADFFAPNGSLAINSGAAAVGRAAIAAVAQSFMEAFPDLHLAMDDLRVCDGLIEYHWTLSGTNTGPGGDGKRVRIRGWEEWEMGNDSMIAESKGHFDEEDYLRQLSGF